MVLPYESWRSSAEAALGRAAKDPHTTTGDTMRVLVTDWPPTDSQAQMRPRISIGSTLPGFTERQPTVGRSP